MDFESARRAQLYARFMRKHVWNVALVGSFKLHEMFGEGGGEHVPFDNG